jgi:hypothetical protein
MKPHLLIALFLLTLAACQHSSTIASEEGKSYHEPQPFSGQAYLVRIFDGAEYESGVPCGYINPQGDTVVAVGKYGLCWTDTIRTFGIVFDQEFIAIDAYGRLLYEVYPYDNGPDWPEEGLFRILRNGKIGYADEEGFIRIEPRFACAEQFSGGRARVALDCELIPDGEYTRMESEEWFFIDREGEVVEE